MVSPSLLRSIVTEVRVDPKAEVPVGLGIVCLGHQAEKQVLRRRLVVGFGRGGERA